MPITKSKAFTTSDGNQYATLEIAQRAELLKLFTASESVTDLTANPVLQIMFDHLDDVKEILRATGRKQRKVKGNGATRKRKTAPAAKAE